MKKALYVLIVLTLITFISCKKDDTKPGDPGDPNESEVITTVKLIFTDTTGSTPESVFVFSDPDGDGGNQPVKFDTIRLNANTVYQLSILLLDESKVPADTISNEVAAEADDHMFFFQFSGVDLSFSYLDSDSNGFGVGLLTRWISGNAGTGTSRIILKHQPGVKDGTITPGETDIDLLFVTEID